MNKGGSPVADKLKAAIIGAGTWGGEAHAHSYEEHPSIELVAVCDLVLDRAERLAARFDVPKTYSDHNEMLKKMCNRRSVGSHTGFCSRTNCRRLCKCSKHILVENP